MGLLPDAWFVRKSTFTGSETFFPREKTLERVAQIQSMKSDNMSLEEIAAAFDAQPLSVTMDMEGIVQRSLSTRGVVEAYLDTFGKPEEWTFDALLQLRLFGRLLESGGIGRQECIEVLKLDRSAFRNPVIYGFRELGVLLPVMVERDAQISAGGKEVFALQISEEAAALRQLLRKEEKHG